ncbi:putative DNA-binding transcriptional regulator YafY [Stella humosa]|uniref:Putative DNA-binding transcriptional regulator YafY n=1 Tax=Stella humosa TaxID=94 RepID=A0A3N1MDZ7_9PROT|nr:WYL domain-containing protein [Stella humosa]ROQ01509.1 putative DNA-binding transcriptional regulator YafY [Stella humosa]BBK31888.1 DNA-binding transcriptional regulator [Stella humosa]
MSLAKGKTPRRGQYGRYGHAELLQRIATAMQASAAGVSLEDIRRDFTVEPLSRSTAERLRNAAERLYPTIEQANPGDRPKRWRIPGRHRGLTPSTSADELADLALAAQILRRDGRSLEAARIEQLALKTRAQLDKRAQVRLEPDLEALVDAEGLIPRAAPQVPVDGATMGTLRRAILANREVHMLYRARGTGEKSQTTLCPYGFLHGNGRHYLVAFSLNPEVLDFRLFALDGIEDLEVLDTSFKRQPFNLAAFASESFGVFRDGEPMDVQWQFSADAASDAVKFRFHPSQTMERLGDGTLIVRFRATGMREMCWHAFTWGSALKILSPPVLRETYATLLAEASWTLRSYLSSQPHPSANDLAV